MLGYLQVFLWVQDHQVHPNNTQETRDHSEHDHFLQNMDFCIYITYVSCDLLLVQWGQLGQTLQQAQSNPEEIKNILQSITV